MNAGVLLRDGIWSSLTILVYLGNRFLYQKHRAWWLSPILASPMALCLGAYSSGTTYRTYIHGTHWLVQLLGPVTVAFAVPIYRYRVLIRKNCVYLAVGILVGCLVASITSWGLATMFHMDRTIVLSIIPRSMSTPFAMSVSRRIGGNPGLLPSLRH
jgi:putative effector of murein hydrolase